MAIVIWSGLNGGASGRVGNSVLAQTQYGTVLRDRPLRTTPNTPAMEAQQHRLAEAIEVYRTLTMEENAAWKQFALSPLNLNPETGKPQGINAYNAFIGLTTRFLMVSPQSDIPRMPPTFPFSGDRLTLSVTSVSGTEQITVTASDANSADVVTELLLRPVKFPAQSIALKEYKSAAFVAFTPDDLTVSLDLASGWYRLATRFVQTTTGLATYRQPYDAVKVLV